MKPETKLALRRWSLRKLRLLFDWLEEQLHAAELRMREEVAGATSTVPSNKLPAALDVAPPAAHPNSFTEWESRRSGLRPIQKKKSRRVPMHAADFDERYAQ